MKRSVLIVGVLLWEYGVVKWPILAMLALLGAALLLHGQALTVMQEALTAELGQPERYVALYRVLRIVAPFALGLWVIWRRKAKGWERVGWYGAMCTGGILAVLSLKA